MMSGGVVTVGMKDTEISIKVEKRKETRKGLKIKTREKAVV
jgi:hypothetical protein